jgi:hypothetical protein
MHTYPVGLRRNAFGLRKLLCPFIFMFRVVFCKEGVSVDRSWRDRQAGALNSAGEIGEL